jgi:hypothetical protein
MFRRLLIVPLLVLLFGVRPAAAQDSDPGKANAPIARRATPKPRQVQKPKSRATSPAKASSSKAKSAPATAAPKKAATKKAKKSSKKSSKKSAPTTVAIEEEVNDVAAEVFDPICRGVPFSAMAPVFGAGAVHYVWDGNFDCGFGVEGLSSYVAVLREDSLRYSQYNIQGNDKPYALGKHGVGGPRAEGGYFIEVMVEGGLTFTAVAPTENGAVVIAQAFVAAVPPLAPTQKLALSNGSCPTPGGDLAATNFAASMNSVVVQSTYTVTRPDQTTGERCVLRSEGADIEVHVWNLPPETWGEFARDFATAGWLLIREPGLSTNAMEVTATRRHIVAMSHPKFGFLRIEGKFAAAGNTGLSMTKTVAEQRARTLAIARALVAMS